MPNRVAATMVGDPGGSGITDSRLPARLTIARGLGAQTEASAQFGAGDSFGARVLSGIEPCSGISHSCWAAPSEKPRQAAVPKRGWSWNNRSRDAKRVFMTGHYSYVML
jgi:hypothetical protein